MENYTPHHPAKLPEDIRAWAREMRGRMTDAEALLWMLLRNRRIAGAKFRRQHPMGRYILDFYCIEKNLCIEFDGGQHSEALEYDHCAYGACAIPTLPIDRRAWHSGGAYFFMVNLLRRLGWR